MTFAKSSPFPAETTAARRMSWKAMMRMSFAICEDFNLYEIYLSLIYVVYI